MRSHNQRPINGIPVAIPNSSAAVANCSGFAAAISSPKWANRKLIGTTPIRVVSAKRGNVSGVRPAA